MKRIERRRKRVARGAKEEIDEEWMKRRKGRKRRVGGCRGVVVVVSGRRWWACACGGGLWAREESGTPHTKNLRHCANGEIICYLKCRQYLSRACYCQLPFIQLKNGQPLNGRIGICEGDWNENGKWDRG